ncbi:hypothetical protein CBM2634_A170300 [Cupriavidus taiwanensis]|uniref:Uncharacterized protein n=1 Tax=Cupriavidus taiwanensis TaxID=164546 RepID=A0A375J091_9BURK|nr:hypothetical protein CBM2634_A170300 [Cupriavidus taiwanensis]
MVLGAIRGGLCRVLPNRFRIYCAIVACSRKFDPIMRAALPTAAGPPFRRAVRQAGQANRLRNRERIKRCLSEPWSPYLSGTDTCRAPHTLSLPCRPDFRVSGGASASPDPSRPRVLFDCAGHTVSARMTQT